MGRMSIGVIALSTVWIAQCSALVHLHCDTTIPEINDDALLTNWDMLLSISEGEISTFQSVEHKIAYFFQTNIVRDNISLDIAVRESDDYNSHFTVVDEETAKCSIFESSKTWTIYAWRRDPGAKEDTFISTAQTEIGDRPNCWDMGVTDYNVSEIFAAICANASRLWPYDDFAMAKIRSDLGRLVGSSWRVFVTPRGHNRVEYTPWSVRCLAYMTAETENGYEQSRVDDEGAREVHAWNVDVRFVLGEELGAIKGERVKEEEEEAKACQYEVMLSNIFAVLFGSSATLLMIVLGRACYQNRWTIVNCLTLVSTGKCAELCKPPAPTNRSHQNGHVEGLASGRDIFANPVYDSRPENQTVV